MDKLPPEILSIVFSYLPQFRKQELMFVCRQWSNIIRSTSLFSTVYISSTKKFGRLTTVLDNNPSYRSQITSLTICGDLKFVADENRGHHDSSSGRLIYMPGGALSVNISSWINRIQNIEITLYSSINSLLSLGVFLGLDRLVITYGGSNLSFSDLRYRAPNINTLKIVDGLISLHDLRFLLTGLPSLRSLTLDYLKPLPVRELHVGNSTHLLTKLSIRINLPCKDANYIVQWLQYITRTCNHLRHFKFIFPLHDFVSLNPGAQKITQNGYAPLLQLLGRQLEYVEISSSYEMLIILNTLTRLDINNQVVRINTLFGYSTIVSVNPQFEKLGKLINQLNIDVNDDILETLSVLKYMKRLKRLKIRCTNCEGYQRLCLKSLLQNCPKLLESLKVYDFNIYMHDMTPDTYQLKELAIHEGVIYKNDYTFISSSFPELKYLTIDQQKPPSDKTINLEKYNLERLEISMKYNGFIKVSTLEDSQSRCYSLGTYVEGETYRCSGFHFAETYETESRRPTKRKIPLDQIEGSQKIIEVICNSIKSLTINERDVHLNK